MTARACCASVKPTECHCALCHRTFTGLTLFDAHQDVDYSRPHAEAIRCRDPQLMWVTPKGRLCEAGGGARLAQNGRGTWGTPEGLKSREIHTTRLAAARSGRAPDAAPRGTLAGTPPGGGAGS